MTTQMILDVVGTFVGRHVSFDHGGKSFIGQIQSEEPALMFNVLCQDGSAKRVLAVDCFEYTYSPKEQKSDD